MVIPSMWLTFDWSISQSHFSLSTSTSYMYLLDPSPLPYPYISAFPLPLPTSSSIYICNPRFTPPLSISLQKNCSTALTLASEKGRTEAIKALLTAPDIDVNHAHVSQYLLTPPYLVLGSGCEGNLVKPNPQSNPRNDDISSPNA